uniref:solute carrier family 35 member F5-like n=1 Tax=Styela clava TaxID=7725 RepID=UPI00193A82B3|nr:solute carrier family 35 member F5-like [Styela clava]
MDSDHTRTHSRSSASKSRFCLGVVLLLLVDVIWVASSELSRYVFTDLDYDKPYLSTYLSISMFSIYLTGFLIIRSWRKKCIRCACDDYPGQYLMIGETDTDTDDGVDYQLHRSLSKPTYVPAKYPSDLESSDTERRSNGHRVKFNDLMEVRHLEDTSAAHIARMSYLSALRAKILLKSSSGNLTIAQIARISCVFALIFFAGNIAYQEALSITEVAVVNVLSSTSSLFTLILSAIFPSDERDKFTLCKLFAVLVCIGGIVLVSVSGGADLGKAVEVGALWALVGSICYAVYLVLLRKVAGDDLNVPMFFAFVGIFTFLLLWPGLLVLHYTKVEVFELPDKQTAIYLIVNGLVGTVLSEILWLWGCLLTTSLIGTLSLSLTIPLSVATDIIIRKVDFTWRFFAGAIPIFLSFIFVTISSTSNNNTSCCCCKQKSTILSEQEIPLTSLSNEDVTES